MARHAAGMRREEVPLACWPLQEPATISSVSDRNAAALRELERMGLMPGANVTVEQRNAAASLSLRLPGRQDPIRLGSDLVSCILVAARPTA
jgi:Fe2+ transport system protein FeoA